MPRGDLPALAQARRAVNESGALHASLPGESLALFEQYATGDREGAARALASMEWRIAQAGLSTNRLAGPENRSVVRTHPYISAIHRLAAARWLEEAGDTLQALRLLPWHEAAMSGDPIYARPNVANRIVEPLALYRRARLENGVGRRTEALGHYRRFIERYDRPPPNHAAWVDDARAQLGLEVANRVAPGTRPRLP